MGNKENRQPLDLTGEEKHTLLMYARSHTIEKRISLRAKIIMDWHKGLTYRESAKKNNVSEMAISKWRRRFRLKRIDGLDDQERSGAPKKISEANKKRVLHLACVKPDNGKRRYSQADIGKMVGISQAKVFQILRESDIKPHKTEYWCGKSPDPEFEEKMINIVGLYLSPPENALVLSVDEKTQIQALDRTQPELPLKQGKNRRLTSTYKRNGTVNLIAALSVHEGTITARTIEKNNTENFLKFLRLLDRKYRNVELHIILDNLSVHKNEKVKNWINKKRKFHLHFTPTYSSWLNQIEIWFNILSRTVLKDGVWQSKQHVVEEIMRYIKYYNEEKANPFNWTYGQNTLN